MIDWERTHNGNATEMSGSNFFTKYHLKCYFCLCICHSLQHVHEQSLYKTDHKKILKIKSCNNFQEKRTRKLGPICFQVKFHWCWCHEMEARKFITEISFLVGSSPDAKADLDAFQGHFSFPLYFLTQEINFWYWGRNTKKAKICWVPCATVSYSQSLQNEGN